MAGYATYLLGWYSLLVLGPYGPSTRPLPATMAYINPDLVARQKSEIAILFLCESLNSSHWRWRRSSTIVGRDYESQPFHELGQALQSARGHGYRNIRTESGTWYDRYRRELT